MLRLDLWLTLPEGETVLVGEAAFGDADIQGRYLSAFRYHPGWLERPRAFALDPAALPLRAEEFQAKQLDAPLMALEDALPDAWGRRLLILRRGLPRGRQSEPFLLQAQAGQGLGALGFFAPGQRPQTHDAAASLLDLAALAEAARQLEAGAPQEPDAACRALLAAGSSPGGARPKALVRSPDGEWIAKFASRRDEVDMVGLEAASLALARQAGLEPPDFRIETLPGGRRALLVRRFDLHPAGGRRHMLSLRALLGAGGHYVLRYADLIAALRRHGDAPEEDAPRLYRQMVFNALLGNTDDHLKNFWMLHDERGWRLSPAFDLLPDTAGQREHVLLFGLDPTPPGPAGLAELGRKWGIPHAAALCAEVREAVQGFGAMARQAGVPPQEIERFSADIARRCRDRGGSVTGGRPA
ncbi:MAG: HipA domain-containing protein [Betaproteobacteria bacterium]|nr:HipA domain-containing protein [Betaproteobacteria bacterium]